jgi:hypothetical protein
MFDPLKSPVVSILSGRRTWRLAFPFVGAVALIAACATSSGTNNGGDGGSSSSSSGVGSSGTGSSGTGSSGVGSSGTGSSGASSSGSSSSSSGAVDAGSDAPVCPNPDQSVLNIDATGFVASICNQYRVQGSWYCFADTYGAPEDNCTQGNVPYNAAMGGMCLSGAIGASFASYVGMGLELNATGGTTSQKLAYNATANNVIGFNVTLSGNSGGAIVRISFTGNSGTPAVAGYVAPFISTTLNGTTTIPVLFTDAVDSIMGTSNVNGKVDPTMIYDLQVEIPGGSAANYNLCITNVSPILKGGDGGAVGGSCSSLMTAGGLNCATTAGVTPAGVYGVQNNINGGVAGQCVQAVAGGTCAGFTASFTSSFGNAGMSTPQSYPSLVYGWQNGTFYGAYPTAKQLSTIATAQSSWQFTVPNSGTWDVSYDTWLDSQPAPATANGGLELMVWPAALGGKNPVGNDTGQSVNFAGSTWEIWSGPITVQNLGSWTVLSYKRNSSSSGTVTPDLAQFFNDALTRNVGLTSSWYLLGIQAGFEVWQQNSGQNMVTNSFNVNVTTK